MKNISQTPSGPDPSVFDNPFYEQVFPENEPEIMLTKFNRHLLSICFLPRPEFDAKNVVMSKILVPVLKESVVL